jgi:AcrR family transcriptional regulator
MTARRRPATRRTPLNRERVLEAAVRVADADGVDGLTMRSVGDVLGVEAMALYRHLANKDELLDGVVETVLARMEESAEDVPTTVQPGEDWREVLRARILRARAMMLRHPWAPGLIAARGTPGTATLRWYDGLCAVLFAGGFSDDQVHHALHALGSRALGFHLELFSADAPEDPDEALAAVRSVAQSSPNIARVVAVVAHPDDGSLGGCDDQVEFEFGLDVLLDGLEARREAGIGAVRTP